MRRSVALFATVLGLSTSLFAQSSCPAGTTTSISGVVYAPNGTDPLPNVLVYVPTAAVDPFTAGVSCPAPNLALPGAPQVGATTGVDGSFTITDVPVGTGIPLVIVSGRWRRQVTVDTTACANTVVDAGLTRFPRNQTEGDIPKFAVATGSVDQVECVLRKVGIDPSEFTNPTGGGRIQLYQGDGASLSGGKETSGGAIIDSSTPAESALMGDASVLSSYDVLMLPCEGGDFTRPSTQLQNLVSFANSGGRVYSSHFAYSWMRNNSPFDTIATWTGSQGNGTYNSGTATVDTSFSEGKTLYSWLQLPAINASPTPGQITLNTIKRDFSAINTTLNQSWLTLNVTGNPVMQFVFDTPVGQKTGQCGRVLYNEYHVENPVGGSATNLVFPSECSNAAMTPQEKLLEYSLFELTNDGGDATLTPDSADFGSVPVGFSSAAHTFTWTNNSTFQSTVSLAAATGDFAVSSNGCTGSIKGGASCNIQVTFSPTALGARTGTLSVGSGAQTLTASLTGTGIPGLTVSPTTLDFGSTDVGAPVTRMVTITNSASGGIAMPALTTTGDYSSTTNCAATVPANSTCTISITFKPTQSGARTGTMSATNISNPAYSQISVSLTGNGLDFTVAMNPASGTVIAGYVASTTSTVSPLAGFAAPVTLTCTTSAPGSACSLSATSITPSSPVTVKISITTTSTYTVVGYGGMGGGLLLLIALGSGWMLVQRRKQASTLLRISAVFMLLAAGAVSMTGCGGKAPAQNASPTSPGNYTYTVTATDGIISHSATFALNVTVR